MNGTDRIELRGIRVMGVHGVLEEERVRAQPFEVDLDVETDLSRAGSSDELGETVDYGAVAEAAAAVVAGSSRRPDGAAGGERSRRRSWPSVELGAGRGRPERHSRRRSPCASCGRRSRSRCHPPG